MKVYAGCFAIASIIAILLALVLGAAAEAQTQYTVNLPAVASSYRQCRLVLFEDGSWMSPDYHPSEGWPPVPACNWVFEEGNCE